ncbi:zinc-finger domain-containing protein [Metabacillus sp. SLBN-84]
MNERDKKQIVHDIDELNDTYCSDCLLKKLFRKERGRKAAHAFCIGECTVGQKMKEYGKKLV